jgi:sulfate transport system permease protein
VGAGALRVPRPPLLDAIVDLPFALPTAVAGIALTALFAPNGWFGALLAPLGITVAYTPLGIMIAMAFTSIPFVVRTVQPVLEDLDPALEEAAQSLGGSDIVIFLQASSCRCSRRRCWRASRCRSRAVSASSAPSSSLPATSPSRRRSRRLLVFIRLEEYDYQAAAAIASVLLITAFVMLAVTNILQARALRYTGEDMTDAHVTVTANRRASATARRPAIP